ncbi:carboxylesterase 1C-like isoform X1 [Branchiostoma floridae]|uniref:Carboxylic ester hydrolase n=3 Tax=Branchiostoma floridae TaxID=7739 RepID=A0A9J7M5Y6_BRAFL|nr:carboxylesterase 1C-like isoform X1 [Branchiostoma floridae]
MAVVRLHMFCLVVAIWVCVSSCGASAGQDAGPVVSTVSGKVNGMITHTTDLPDKPIYTFLGIPYAAPPVGDLRYRPPEPAPPWEGVREAVEYGPYCPQNLTMLSQLEAPIAFGEDMTMNEDCLTANVYTPTVDPDASLPVLLWIHGGGLMCFYGSPPGWEAIAAYQDVVVVSFNYRLGVLGFLSTGDENMPGNYGFLDQVRAMEWVKENIQNFGGDPERVTIFGESAGAISVSYQLLSPLSKGLFQRAISQSGTWKTFPVNPQPLAVTKIIAENAGCESTEDTAILTACLKEKSPEELLDAFQALGPMAYLVPVVDGTFLTTDPSDLMKNGEINTADYLLGFNNHEGGWMGLSSFLEGDPHDGITQEEFVKLLKTTMSFIHHSNPNLDKMVDAVVAEYKPTNPDDPMSILYQFTHTSGDSYFAAPTILVAESHTDAGSRVFLYENQYRPSIHPNKPDWVGCEHGDDLFMLWGFPFLEATRTVKAINYSKEDEEVTLEMMAYWANFARTGDPSDSTGGPTDSPSLPTWPQYTPDNPVYMKLDVVPTTEVGYKPEKMKLWNEVIPQIAAEKKDEL